MGHKVHPPEQHSVVKVADGGQAGDGPLGGKAGLHKGPRVEHAQEPVDDDLEGGRWRPHTGLLGPAPRVTVSSGPAGSAHRLGVVQREAGGQVGHPALGVRVQTGSGRAWAVVEGPRLTIVGTHFFALGWRWVEAVVGQVASEDTQLAGDDPPGLAQLCVARRWEEGPEVAGSKHCARRSCSRPVTEAGQGQAGDLEQGAPKLWGSEKPTTGVPCSMYEWRPPQSPELHTGQGSRGLVRLLCG